MIEAVVYILQFTRLLRLLYHLLTGANRVKTMFCYVSCIYATFITSPKVSSLQTYLQVIDPHNKHRTKVQTPSIRAQYRRVKK